MISNSIKILKSMQHPTGLLSASRTDVTTGYNRAWIRDNIYQALGFESVKKQKEVKQIYHGLLNALLKHEDKIDHAIRVKPTQRYQYIHARVDPITLDEIEGEWGNMQNDSIGAFLFKIGDLEEKGIRIIRDHNDLKIIQKLVWYLRSVEYWHDEDNGVWEENEEVHASSVGACVAGLKKIAKIPGIEVPRWLISNGQAMLDELLPKESVTKITDLALLSLIYPFNVVSNKQRDHILSNVETLLVRNKGVIRYIGDVYYNPSGNVGNEAEWCFGFPWLAKIYKDMGVPNKYAFYYKKTMEAMTKNKELPELYFSGTDEYNENTPLGWSQAMFLVMMEE